MAERATGWQAVALSVAGVLAFTILFDLPAAALPYVALFGTLPLGAAVGAAAVWQSRNRSPLLVPALVFVLVWGALDGTMIAVHWGMPLQDAKHAFLRADVATGALTGLAIGLLARSPWAGATAGIFAVATGVWFGTPASHAADTVGPASIQTLATLAAVALLAAAAWDAVGWAYRHRSVPGGAAA